MLVYFHKGFIDQFGTTIDVEDLVHNEYIKNRKLFLMDVIMNAPIDIIPSMLGLHTETTIIILSFFRTNRLIRMIRLQHIFSSWIGDIQNK